MELSAYIAILWRRKWVIAATVTATLIITVIGTLMATPGYVASTTLRVATAASGSANNADFMYAERLMNTQAKIATSSPVPKELSQQLGLDQPRPNRSRTCTEHRVDANVPANTPDP